MEYRTLGRSGLQVSLLGLGGNNFGRQVDAATTAAIVNKCVDLGITFFDSIWTSRSEHLEPFICAKNQYSLLDRAIEKELGPACLKYGVGVVPFYPLASGLLTGKYRSPEALPEGSRLSLNLPIYRGVL